MISRFKTFRKRVKKYDPRDLTMTFVDRQDDLDPHSKTFSETCLVKSENDDEYEEDDDGASEGLMFCVCVLVHLQVTRGPSEHCCLVVTL